MKPLLVSDILEYSSTYYQDTQIVTYYRNSRKETTYQKLNERCKQLSYSFEHVLGLKKGTTIGTLAFNSTEHLEICYASCGMGLLFHPINTKYDIKQIVYSINHSEDKIIFYNKVYNIIVQSIKDLCPFVDLWICIEEQSYSNLFQFSHSIEDWPMLEETSPCCLYYTSGTTGNPKGVIHSHRSIVLHSLSVSHPNHLGLSNKDNVLVLPSFSHINGWGLTFSVPLAGGKMVFFYDSYSLIVNELFWKYAKTEQITFSSGVCSLWKMIFDTDEYLKDPSLITLKKINIAGSTCSPDLLQKFNKYNIDFISAWGMTEIFAHGSCSSVSKSDLLGKPIFGVNFKVDTDNQVLLNGYWVPSGYYRLDNSDCYNDSWFVTGDVGTLENGIFRLLDRKKDLIKKGGEWISSIQIENAASPHPNVKDSCCIGIPDIMWDEVPVLVITLRNTLLKETTINEVSEYITKELPSRYIPSRIIVLDEIPMTSTGKYNKLELKCMLKNLL